MVRRSLRIDGRQQFSGDGEDISQAWFAEDYTQIKPLFWKTSSPSSAPAIRDGQWKLHLSRKRDHGIQLYDLSNVPSESHNVAAANPKVAARLKKQLRAWVAELPSEYDKGEKR